MTVMNHPSLDYYQDSRIDLATVLRLLFDHKTLILCTVSLFFLLGLGYAVLATPVYQANAMIQIEPKKIGIEGIPEVNNKPLSVSQATIEIELIKSRTLLGEVVDALQLNVLQTPELFPVIGPYLYRTFSPERAGELAQPWFGLTQYAWGGEKIDIFQLDVPEYLLGEPLTLIAGKSGQFSLYDEERNLLLRGATNRVVEGKGIKIQVATLQARPGTEFIVSRQRTLSSALAYQDRLKIMEAGRDSGIIYLSIEDQDAQKANRIIDEVSRLYVRQNVERSSAEAAQRLQFLRSQLPMVRKQLEESEVALNNFQTSAKSVDLSIETKGVLDQVVGLDSMLSELKLKRVELERLYTREHRKRLM
ncbi:Wzz/FepE/Etk N-terminal domain-containing protein, partial [Pseudomonas syringae group genomosp. 3]